MTSINEIFRSFAPEYLERYANSMPKTHRKAIDALIACRTEACGLARYQCETCAGSHEFYRSCGNRHCPTCQRTAESQVLRSAGGTRRPLRRGLGGLVRKWSPDR